MRKKSIGVSYLLPTLLFLTSIFYNNIYAMAAECPTDEVGVTCKDTCGGFLGSSSEEILPGDYSCDGGRVCCFEKVSCPVLDPSSRYRCATVVSSCPSYGDGWEIFENTIIEQDPKCKQTGYETLLDCCVNTLPACGDAGGTCMNPSSCSSNDGHYPINGKFCPDDDQICCSTNSQNCECSSNGGFCSSQKPGDDYGESTYSCDDPSCVGTGTTCWVPATCGYIGQICCPGDTCYAGYPYTPASMGSCQCLSGPLRPPALVYSGPVIENLEDIIGPVVKMLYYGGLAIGVFFIILSGYKIMVSEGDPQRVKAAQEQLTSAVIGIIFILLSVTIIRIIIDSIVTI